MKRKIGIYAGTFDPIHEGHIAFAREALKTCHLDRVIFLPEPSPRYKKDVTNINTRLQNAKSAIGRSPFYKVHHSSADQFTMHSIMPEIESLYPDASIVLLVGSDVTLTLHTWENITELTRSVQFVIGLRGNATKNKIVMAMNALSTSLGTDIRYSIISTQHSAVSSSQKRLQSTHP